MDEGKIERENLTSDPEFASVGYELGGEEDQFLAELLREDGCREPIMVWDTPERPIIDGHQRYRLCLKHGIQYKVVAKKFPDRTAVLDWIARNQLGRRNASETQKGHIRGWLRLRLEEEALSGQTSPEIGSKERRGPGRPRNKILHHVAAITGVSTRQINRDTAFAREMEELDAKSHALRDAALREEIDRKDAVTLSSAPVEVVKGVEAAPASERKAAAKAAADAIRSKPTDSSGKPVADIRALAKLESMVGAIVRAKTDALKACVAACGGKHKAASIRHEAVIREHLNAIFDEIVAWKSEVQGERNAT